MRVLALALLLSACAPRYLMVTETNHGPVIWDRYKTRQACEEARQYDQITVTRCMTARELRRR